MKAEIHITDLQTFLQCRRRWDWSSLLRRRLQRATMPPALFLGQGVHVALDASYSSPDAPDMAASIAAFKAWVKQREKAIEEFSGPLWDDERAMIQENHDLGVAMLAHYHCWIAPLDVNYEVVATEEKFKVPIPLPPSACHGVGHKWLSRAGHHYDFARGIWLSGDIVLAGRFDGVVRDKRTGDLYLLEFKTAGSITNVSWTFRGLQGAAYAWAAKWLYGDLKGILYRVLRKKAPALPRRLKRGGYSQAKSQDSTFLWFKYCFERIAEKESRGPKELFRENKEILSYLNSQEPSLRENAFFLERLLEKTPGQLDSVMSTVYHVGMEMADPYVDVFAAPSWGACNWCPFKDPCTLMEYRGLSQAEALLEAEYAPRDYWEETGGE